MKMKELRLIKPTIGESEIESVTNVLKSGWITEGVVTKEFEEEFAKYIGVKYAKATTSCTTGLEAILKMMSIDKSTCVVVPSFTHPSTVDVIRLVGATPLFVDVNLDNYCINWEQVDIAIKKFKVGAIIPVSWGGYPLDNRIVSSYIYDGYKVVEDAACSHGSSYRDRMSGSIGNAGCFSFHPRKIITTGEGGMITTNDEDLANDISIYKNFGFMDGRFVGVGSNLRMSDILASIGIVQLKKVEKTIEKRISMAVIYDELLDKVDWSISPTTKRGVRHNYQSYCIRLIEGNRDKLIFRLKNFGIETQIGTYALHLQPSFNSVYPIGDLKNSEILYKNLLTLPMSYDMTYSDQEFVIKKIGEII